MKFWCFFDTRFRRK